MEDGIAGGRGGRREGKTHTVGGRAQETKNTAVRRTATAGVRVVRPPDDPVNRLSFGYRRGRAEQRSSHRVVSSPALSGGHGRSCSAGWWQRGGGGGELVVATGRAQSGQSKRVGRPKVLVQGRRSRSAARAWRGSDGGGGSRRTQRSKHSGHWHPTAADAAPDPGRFERTRNSTDGGGGGGDGHHLRFQ